MVNMCRFDSSKRCYWSGCSSLDSMGNVVVCSLVPNPDGFFMERKIAPVHVSVWSKHVLRRGS